MQVYSATSTTHELRKAWCAGDNGPMQDEQAEGYRYAKNFIFERHVVPTLESYRDLLNRLSDVAEASIVLGCPKHDRGGRTGLDFDDMSYSQMIVDLDSLEFEGTAEEAVRFALPFLADRQFVYAYSPSSGFKPGHRLRVVFECEPMDLSVMKIHAVQMNNDLSRRLNLNRTCIDSSIYKPSGFVFTARPALEGLTDPHPVRAHFVDGKKGPVELPTLPDMVDISKNLAVKRGIAPVLNWTGAERHNAVFNFMVGYRTAFPDSTPAECWVALKAEYDRIGVSGSDQHEFGARYIETRFRGVRGAKTSEKAFATSRDEVPLDVAAARLKKEIGRFVQDPDRAPKVKVIRADAGLGKTHWALHWLGVESRYCREKTVGSFNVDLYVPNHNLSAQIENDARAHGMTAFTELGRGQELNGRPVCTKHEAIKKVQGIVKETRKAFCGNEESQCSDRPGCLWWAMHDKSLTHDLRLRTHAHLPIQIANTHGQSRVQDFVVIDENFIGALIKDDYVEVKDLCDVTRHDMGEWLFRLFGVIKDGLTFERLGEAGFTVDVCKELIKAEMALAPDVEITPDMSAREALSAATDYDGKWYKYASFWRRLRDALESQSLNRLRVTPNKKGVVLNWRRKIAGIPWDSETDRPRVPVLILSATIKRSMIEAVLPVDEWVDIEVEKHADAKVVQIPMNASKSALLYGTGDRVKKYDERDKGKKAAAANFRADVEQVSRGRNLFAYKDVNDFVPLEGWFNAVEGLNDWAGCNIDIVGRPLPEPLVVEDMARAIHQDGAPIVADGLWYKKQPIAFVGGKGMAWCERHSDPRVEDVRWTVCEGAMTQAASRARYVRDSCEVRLFTNMVLPIEVDEVVVFDSLRPEEQEYVEAPVRVVSPSLAKVLFRKFEGMSANGFKQAVGNVARWTLENCAEPVEIRLAGQRQWQRAFVAQEGWAWLRDRVEIAETRDLSVRKDDNYPRINEFQKLAEHQRDRSAFIEAFEREEFLLVEYDGGEVVDKRFEGRTTVRFGPWPRNQGADGAIVT